ncbi:tetratricopeptide repeat protein [Desulfococcaceae bacterium HSG8]|nr:tetratricopeptide repeat protein [Desulfococcaceae bacterium HSG8]
MSFYANLVILGLTGTGLSAYLFFRVPDPNISFMSSTLSYILSLLITFILTKKDVEREYEDVIDCLKKEYKTKIHRLKREHDTTTLEKTIRDGTQTLIKNALDYFKIENIKNEVPASAAIQNLQLDKYGQIIELLADFSLILPDYKENQEIVQHEIVHQIEIYRVDEKDFAHFLERIMKKYLITVNKKIREKTDLHMARRMKRCPKCAEKILPEAKICKHCGHVLKADSPNSTVIPGTTEVDWLRKGQALYRSGNLNEALSMLTNAIDLNPKFSLAYYHRGIVNKKMGNKKRAMDDLKIAAQLGHRKAQETLKSTMMIIKNDS